MTFPINATRLHALDGTAPQRGRAITQPAGLRNYTRWRQINPATIEADLLGARIDIAVHTGDGTVVLNGEPLTPDEARLIGVRLVEGAALADGPRAIRQPPGAGERM